MDTQKLIDSLVSEGARKPLPHPYRQTLYWLVGMALWLAAFSIYMGFRSDIFTKSTELLYILEAGNVFLIAISSGLAGFCLSRPDGYQMPRIRYIPFFFLILWGAVAFAGADHISFANILYAAIHCDFHCVLNIFTFSIAPGIAIFLIIRKGAALQPGLAGSMAVLSATAFGYLFMRLVEPNDDPLHLMFSHAIPIAIMCVAGIMAGKYMLRWL